MTSPTVHLKIEDVEVDMNVFGNEDRTSQMKITTTEGYALCLEFFVNAGQNTIGAIITHTVGDTCPCCKEKGFYCKKLNKGENMKKVLQDAYAWMQTAKKYRLQWVFGSYKIK
ncbi:hypothetical protein PDM83_09905 [Bacillus cereus]|nr:hypothetical protein [Bacillus cereus]MCU5674983.1 hypothetical protein [Bacillus cereus]MDA2097430.1 hypothetical protein [Bacillus cereus]MDA2103841.1 hypothetical protein [Bacillus cereus]